MNYRSLTPWLCFLFSLGLVACDTGLRPEQFEAHLTQKADVDVCDQSSDDFDPFDPRCDESGPGGTGVFDPEPCPGGDPTCNRSQAYPTQYDLTVQNSSNVAFSSGANGLRLLGGSSNLVDSDGDDVPDEADECPGPGWRTPCDGDPTNDGIYQTVYYDVGNEITLGANINVDGKIRTADAYILMDATGSMGGEQAQLIRDLTKGTFIDPEECPGAAETGLAGALKCVVENVWMGLGQFNEYPFAPHGHNYGYAPYHHHLDVTDNLQHLLDAVSTLRTKGNRDTPEATTQALYSVVTGQGLGPWVPNRQGCPEGHWGYPCFRPTALPIVMLFTDDEMQNGPRPQSPLYRDFGATGRGTRIPPVIQDPGMLYSSNAVSAHDFGDLTTTSMTAMGTNSLFGNNFNTSPASGACHYCNSKGCWGDGRDGVITFTTRNLLPSVKISSDGTFYPDTKVALFDSSLSMYACGVGPGGGNLWGRLDEPLPAGRWFAVSDPRIAPNKSVNSARGPFQIRIQTTADDPSWQTADAPVDWTTVETELLANAIKVVSILSPGNGSNARASLDIDALAYATGSVDQFGEPYVETIQGNGQGLTTAVLDAVRSLVGDTRRDVTIIPVDNPATPTVDESQFVGTVTATQCPTTGINNCLGGEGTDTCIGCLADSDLDFEFRVGNSIVPPSSSPQVFDFNLVSYADGSVELSRIPVRVLVPPAGVDFGTGYFETDYSAELACTMPPERPDWGTLTWVGALPSDTKLEFEIFTGNTLEELDEDQIPVSVIVPDDAPGNSFDLGQALLTNGAMNYMPFVRVRAKMLASSDRRATPILSGWTTEFNCIPFD